MTFFKPCKLWVILWIIYFQSYQCCAHPSNQSKASLLHKQVIDSHKFSTWLTPTIEGAITVLQSSLFGNDCNLLMKSMNLWTNLCTCGKSWHKTNGLSPICQAMYLSNVQGNYTHLNFSVILLGSHMKGSCNNIRWSCFLIFWKDFW